MVGMFLLLVVKTATTYCHCGQVFFFRNPFGSRPFHKFTSSLLYFMVLVQCGLAQSGSTYHRPNVVFHAMSLCAACAGTADLRQPLCTPWCRLRAAGECRRHARATAACPQTVSWPPLPFSQQIPTIFS